MMTDKVHLSENRLAMLGPLVEVTREVLMTAMEAWRTCLEQPTELIRDFKHSRSKTGSSLIGLNFFANHTSCESICSYKDSHIFARTSSLANSHICKGKVSWESHLPTNACFDCLLCVILH
jgi:hypothetical protein